jgi:hypothetical protein
MAKELIGEIEQASYRYKVELEVDKEKFLNELKEKYNLTDKQTFEIYPSLENGEIYLLGISTKYNGELNVIDLQKLK